MPFTVLGKRLKPFSRGHNILLRRFGSNFAVGASESPGYSDLILSVFICSHTYEGALNALSSRWLWLRLKFWGFRFRRFNVLGKINLFARYIAHHTQEPKYWIEKEGDGRGSGIPNEQFDLSNLMQFFGCSYSEALNLPYPVGTWNLFKLLEQEGIVRVWTDRDYEMQAAAKAMEEKEAA